MASSGTQPQPGPFGGLAQPQRPARTGRTCFLVGLLGCLTILLLGVLALALLYFGARAVFTHAIDEFTDTAPVPLPEVALPESEAVALRERLDAFKEALAAGEPTESLSLSGEEINALIQYDPDWEELKGKIYVSIEADKLRGQVSIPLEPFEQLPMIGSRLKGRYFNGSAAFDIFLRNGVLFVFLHSAELKGNALPEEFMAGFRAENLAKDFPRTSPELAALLDELEQIEIRDGYLRIVPKRLPQEESSAGPSTDATTLQTQI